MAKQVQQPAKGNSGDTAGPVVTPAPTKPPRIRFSDDFGGKGDLNYGRNRQNLPASVEPGATVESDLAKDLRTTIGDPVLSAVQQHGTAAMRTPLVGDHGEDVRGMPSTQIHDVSAANKTPTTFGMRSRNNEGGTVPSALGASGNGQPVRKP